MKRLIAAAALGSALFAMSASAQDGPRHDPLSMADANNDGIVTKDEMRASVDAQFAKLDADHNGKIEQTERKAIAKKMRGAGEKQDKMDKRAKKRGEKMMMRRLDGDGDGAVSLAEMRAQADKRFDRVDTNKDGKIDQAERAAVRERMKSMRAAGGRHGPPADGADGD